MYVLVYWVWVWPVKSVWVHLLGAVLVLGLIPLPFVAWKASMRWHSNISLTSGAIAYLLMAPILWHACWWLVLGVLNGVLWLVVAVFPQWGVHPLTPFAFRAALLSLVGLTLLYSIIETLWLQVRTLVIRTPALPAGSRGLCLVQISDVHLDVYPWSTKSGAIIRKIKQLKPDLILSTGDFLDSRAEQLADQSAAWAEVAAPLGKYAVFGNHEGYRALENGLRFHDAAGFTLLRGRAVRPCAGLVLAGVDDPSVQNELHNEQTCTEEQVSWPAEAAGDEFRILMKHQPSISAWAQKHIHLQLSGHTHGGQIFPFHLLVKLAYPAIEGTLSLPPSFRLHVNRGTGHWGPPLRFLAPPEITRIQLLPEEEESSAAA